MRTRDPPHFSGCPLVHPLALHPQRQGAGGVHAHVSPVGILSRSSDRRTVASTAAAALLLLLLLLPLLLL